VDARRLDAPVGRLPRGDLPDHLHALSATVVALAVAVALAAWAPAAHAADAEAGRRKAAACQSCHGADGNATLPGTPSLAGQPAWFTHWALIKFRDGRRKDAVMSPLTANLSDADLADLAAYYAAQPPRPRPQAVDPAKAAAGRQLAVAQNCTSCHRPDLAGQHQVPRLAGQDIDYVVKMLRAYKARTAADLDGLMTMAAQSLTEADIASLAHFIASPGAP
jgi:cytochrome c553